jgi:hypothetical protein
MAGDRGQREHRAGQEGAPRRGRSQNVTVEHGRRRGSTRRRYHATRGARFELLERIILVELRDDGSGLLEYRCERLHDVEELLDHLEKSSHAIKEAVAVRPIFRHDGFGSRSVLEESLHVVFRR